VPRIQLRELCATRSGDKGDICNVAIFAYSAQAFAELQREATAARVKEHLGALVQGDVVRYEAPNVLALNFVLHGALGGGGPRSLRSDNLGKTMGGAVLRMEVEVSPDVAAAAPGHRPVVN
jgi:hypothetical protein